MDPLAFVASLVSSLAWPAVALIVVILLKTQLAELLGRVLEAEVLGVKAKFDPKKAEPSVALATATTLAATVAEADAAQGSGQAFDPTVVVREPLATKLAAVAEQEPNAAVLAAYSDIEKALKLRLRDAKVPGIEKLAGGQLVDVAFRKGQINRQTADAIRRVLDLRNLAAHGLDVDPEKALEYLSLVDAVLYSIEARHRYGKRPE